MAEAHHSLSLRLLDQAAVDSCIDDLRRQNISIVGRRSAATSTNRAGEPIDLVDRRSPCRCRCR